MTRQQLSVLGAQPFLRGMPSAELAELAELCEHVSIPSRQRLFAQGRCPDRGAVRHGTNDPNAAGQRL